ncbi:MAG: PorP/SprF family type IX secretion system membrane protein [Bacteroidota bacterium]
MKKAYAILVGLVFPLLLWGQDPHFSQFGELPIYYNPAQMGNFVGKTRIQAGYRKQWGNVGKGFTGSLAAADLNLGDIGLGIEIVDDGTGQSGMRHTNLLLGMAYHRKWEAHQFSIGVKGGMIQRSLDPSQLSFDTQYDPEIGYDPTLPNREPLTAMKLSVGDLHGGLAYQYQAPGLRLLRGFGAELSFAHVNQPNVSLMNGVSTLPTRLAFRSSATFQVSARMQLEPQFLWMRQGTAREWVGGITLRQEVNQEVFAQFGLNYRSQDALIPHAGLEFNHTYIGLSYDMNIGILGNQTSQRGGPELVLRYIFNEWKAPVANYEARDLKRLNDRDGDGIKDQRDRCPDIPGSKKFAGCPDSDGDGIVDDEDLCPTLPGPADRNGCPAKDRDGDGVLDRADACPDEPGLIAFKGCPDTDGDDLPDHIDKCPNQPGPRVRSGCPSSDIDADGDLIPDKIDLCPTLPGLPEFQGCPDTDEDGIPDFEDLCPTIKGTAERRGCPQRDADTDRDGIKDELDKCPTVRGLPQFEGCPDSDGDGISDFEDNCPLTPGAKSNQGCPTQGQDADGDGILDGTDPCPYVPGKPEFQGCPDSDGDGIPDGEDACPTVYGQRERQGCPADPASPQPMVPGKVPASNQFGPVEFASDQAIIPTRYFDELNRCAAYMKTNAHLKLLLVGHTDYEGDQMYNMILGQNRSRAVKYYLQRQGVASDRIQIVSYGENLPTDDNSNSEGRARNRRTELQLVVP